ncbi:MAG: hypothetical protein M1831_001363 [Alyxoria varia]|nr:MAG: hypothetical protein M1831_001363 [Alyxoria varia]
MASTNKPPKTAMSSRLLGMKFMQRATPSTGRGSEEMLDEPAGKRQKLGNECADESQQTSHFSRASNEDDINRRKVLDRQAEEAGDTKWILNQYSDQLQLLEISVLHAAWTLVDSQFMVNDLTESPQAQGQVNPGRKSFGQFNKNLESRSEADTSQTELGHGQYSQNGSAHDVSGESEPNSQPSFKNTQKGQQPRRSHNRHGSSMEESKIAQAGDRGSNQLKKMKSISSGGRMASSQGNTRQGSKSKDTKCFTCHNEGHKARDCPSR